MQSTVARGRAPSMIMAAVLAIPYGGILSRLALDLMPKPRHRASAAPPTISRRARHHYHCSDGDDAGDRPRASPACESVGATFTT